MGNPLRDMDRDLIIRDLAARSGVNLHPLARMDQVAAVRRIFAATGQPWSGPLHDIDAALADAEVAVHAHEAEEEGGGGAPEWVPENALIHIDFQRAFNELDAAYVDGVGVVAVDTLLGTDANTSNGWGATSYDAGNLTADGYVDGPGSSPVALIGAALTAALSSTTVVTAKFIGTTEYVDFTTLSADGNAAFGWTMNPSYSVAATSWTDAWTLEFLESVVDDGVNKVAMTLVSNRVDISANGATAQTHALDGTSRPVASPWVAWLFDGRDNAIQSITIYAALPDTTGLSALSAVA